MMARTLPSFVHLVEVGPRDGLQNEKRIVSTQAKVAFINALSASGLKCIETGSMVSAQWVPQMGDSSDVFRLIDKSPGVRYPLLTPNQRGLKNALQIGAKEIAVFTAASDTFNKKNINKTVAESLVEIEEVVRQAKQNGLWVRGYVSTIIHCPYDGNIDPQKAVDVSLRLFDMGIDELSLGDTIGRAIPDELNPLFDLLLPRVSREKVAMHFHDTTHTALANIERSLQYGINIFDASAGGLGGCPYAPGSSGNVATESVLELLSSLNIATGVDIEKVRAASRELQSHLS